MKIRTLAIEWHMSSQDIINILESLGIPTEGADAEITEQQLNILCDEFSKDYSDSNDKIIDAINKLGPFTARMSPYERITKIYEIRNQLLENYSEISNPEKSNALRKVESFLDFARINFKEAQEKVLEKALEKYNDLQIEYQKNNKGKYIIDILIEPFTISLEYSWKQEIRMSLSHRTEESEHPIFPNAEDIKNLIFDKVKFVRGEYVFSSAVESWPQDIETILLNIRNNIDQLLRLFDNSTLRFPDGTMKVRRKMWKSPARMVGISLVSEREKIQKIKKKQQPLYDNTPGLYGSNGTYVTAEERYYVLEYKIFRPKQERYYPLTIIEEIDNFLKSYYLPKLQRQKMSASLLEEINRKLSTINFDVVTRDFDEKGAVSNNAVYLPNGFESWFNFLKSIL